MPQEFEGAMKRNILLIACAVILLGAAGRAAWAEEAPPAPDAAAGKAVAAACAACHGTDGISREKGVPSLAGQHQSYIQASLVAYKKGDRTGEAMQKVVANLSDQDMANVAAYFAGLKSFSERPAPLGGEAAPEPETDPFAAVKEKTAACAGCHGADGNSIIPGMPSLAGQQVAYLIAAMKDYQDGARQEPMMQGMVAALSRSDLEDVAYYYATMEPHPAPAPAEGDPYAGIALAAKCASCHGDDGNSRDPKNPRLAGLGAEYLVVAINAYKNGTRKSDVMADAVETLRDEDVKDLAAFYATKEPKAPLIRKPLTVAEWTERCSRCHGSGGNSTDQRFPILAGQDQTYLETALEHYHGGSRVNAMMFAMSFLMGESDIKKLAAYYARQRKE